MSVNVLIKTAFTINISHLLYWFLLYYFKFCPHINSKSNTVYKFITYNLQ